MKGTVETKQLSVSVDGNWITEMARYWFWEENRPYSDAENLILCCLSTPKLTSKQKKLIAQDIIEGRRKLTGINELTIEDDGTNIRPISNKLKEVCRKLKIKELQEKMTYNMIDYVDPYSTVKSISSAEEFGYTSLSECQTWFLYRDECIQNKYKRPIDLYEGMLPASEKATVGGLWLYNCPDIVYDAMETSKGDPVNPVTKYDFWQAVYDIIINRPEFDTPDFKCRNEKYLASMRVKKNKETAERNLLKSLAESSNDASHIEEKSSLNEIQTETLEFIEKFFEKHPDAPTDDANPALLSQYKIMHIIRNRILENGPMAANREIYILPDSYELWEGLIAPNGDFYSCDFAGHNCKAYYLLRAYPEKFPNLDYNEIDIFGGGIKPHNALDYILEQGWCATRTLGGNSYITPPTNGRFTKAQENAIFDAQIKHDVNIDLSILGY